MPYQRDPLSELFDPAARALLSRAYANPGKWAGTRLADPSLRHIAYANARDIYPLSRDTVPGGQAKTRWARAFVRCLYYQHKWWSGGGTDGWRGTKRTAPRESGALIVEVGNVVVARGVIPRGRAVRVKLAAGGRAKDRAVQNLPVTKQYTASAAARSHPQDRDW